MFGIVGNNPNFIAGVLDINASIKAAQFVPFLRLLQYPAHNLCRRSWISSWNRSRKGWNYQEHRATFLYAYCEATVPKLTVITRKAYGGAYDVMSSKHIGADLNPAWPGAEIP